MIYFKLDKIIMKLNISQNEFARRTDIRPNTINNFVNNKVNRIEIGTLNKILNEIVSHGYNLSDLMEYKNEK